MQGRQALCVVGVRPDGTVGVRLFSDNQSRAGLLASFVLEQNSDWDVRIETIPDNPGDAPIVLSRSKSR